MASNPWSGTIAWLRALLMHALGRGTPVQGMKAAATLFVITFASNFIGLLFTIVLDIFFAILFLIHLGRYTVGRLR